MKLAPRVFAVITGCAVGAASPAMACTFRDPPPTLKQLVEESDVVVRGTLFRLRPGEGFIVPEAIVKGPERFEYPVLWDGDPLFRKTKSGLIITPPPPCGGRIIPSGATRAMFLLNNDRGESYSIYSLKPVDALGEAPE